MKFRIFPIHSLLSGLVGFIFTVASHIHPACRLLMSAPIKISLNRNPCPSVSFVHFHIHLKANPTSYNYLFSSLFFVVTLGDSLGIFWTNSCIPIQFQDLKHVLRLHGTVEKTDHITCTCIYSERGWVHAWYPSNSLTNQYHHPVSVYLSQQIYLQFLQGLLPFNTRSSVVIQIPQDLSYLLNRTTTISILLKLWSFNKGESRKRKTAFSIPINFLHHDQNYSPSLIIISKNQSL